jgi:hypothetical protein
MVFSKELLMERKYAVIGGVLALILVGWLCWYLSDKQVIKRQLIGLSWEVNKKSRQESTMEMALKMREIKEALAAGCQVTVPESRFSDTLEPDMAIMYLMHYRDRYETIAATFTDIRIAFPAKGEAAVQATVLLERQTSQAPPAAVSAPVTLALQKQPGGWRLTKVEIAAALVND